LAFLRIEGVTGKSLRRQEQKTSSYDPLQPEHEATGQVFLGRLYDMYKYVHIFLSGGFDPRVVMINSMNIIEIITSCFLTSNYGTVHTNKFDK
jgi:hypothetical protein